MEGNRRLGLGLEWILGFGVEDENGGEARLFCSFFFVSEGIKSCYT